MIGRSFRSKQPKAFLVKLGDEAFVDGDQLHGAENSLM